MFNLDPGKLLIIGVVAVMVLGPEKLPRAAHQLGGAWRTFNQFRARMEAEVRQTIPDLPSTDSLARLARSPAALLEHLGTMDSSVHEPGPSAQVLASRPMRASSFDTRVPSDDTPAPGDAGLN